MDLDKGRKILISIGMGMILLAFLDINIPVSISVGITVFVTILTIYDFAEATSVPIEIVKRNDKTNIERALDYFFIFHNIGHYLLMTFREVLLFTSIPIAIFISEKSIQDKSIEELNSIQQTLTLYTLGLVILIVALPNLKKYDTSANR